MARDFAKQFYKSKQWQKCRASYILKRQGIDGGMCETCHQEPGKIVHHKIWLSPENINDPNISLNHENLKYECQTCHNKEGCQKKKKTDDIISERTVRFTRYPPENFFKISEWRPREEVVIQRREFYRPPSP